MVPTTCPVASISRRNKNPRNASSVAKAPTSSVSSDNNAVPQASGVSQNCGCKSPTTAMGRMATSSSAQPNAAPFCHSLPTVARHGSALVSRMLPLRVPTQWSAVYPVDQENEQKDLVEQGPQEIGPDSPGDAVCCTLRAGARRQQPKEPNRKQREVH